MLLCEEDVELDLAESVSTIAKLYVPMNMIGGSQMHPQQHSIVHLWWKAHVFTITMTIMENL
ncbi:hypothetical protein SFRURICE_001065 [Spodoptera frugiperda]|nr:hypothetical protein SFRURICE_001065 [Spodoptera frugiperda]